MSGHEIEVPRELRQFMPEWAKETFLGQKNGANRQYRYGNLHIREYDDRFVVHMDRVDPRKDPLGHLVADAPEILVGMAIAILAGKKAAPKKHSNTLYVLSALSAAAAGYIGYAASKKIKELAR